LDDWDDDNDVAFDPPVLEYADYLPSWGSTNATVTWYGESWIFNLQVKNLLDKKYLQSFSDGWADDIDLWYPGEDRFRETAVYNRPREITLQIRKEF
jgi:outer membrane receptor protein involved in Fe transport